MKQFSLPQAVGSGQLLVMLSIFLCLFSLPASSWAKKNPLLPSFEVETGFIVNITPKIYDPSGSNACSGCCYPINCRRALYQVRLFVIHPSSNTIYNNGNFELSYEQLSLTVQAYVDPNGGLTRINKTETESCLVSFLQSGDGVTFTADEAEHSATLLLSDMTLGDMETLPVIEFNNYESQVLFTVVVDFFPEESTGAVHTNFSYVSVNEVVNTASGSTQGTYPSKYPAPSTDNSTFTLLLDDLPTCTDDYAIFPVLLNRTSGTSTVQYLDFSITVASTDSLYGPPVIQNYLSGVNQPTIRAVPLFTGTGYVYHIQYVNAALSGNPTLFEIKVPTPALLSAGYNISATLAKGRLALAGGDIAACSPSDYILQVLPATGNQADPCSLKVYITLRGPSTIFDEVYFQIDFDMPGTVTIDDVTLVNMSCPTDNICSSCESTPGGQTVELCVKSTTGIALTNNSYIVVDIYAPTGCINDVIFRKAELRKHSGGGFCIPILYKSGFPYCPPLAQGNIATENGCYVDEVAVSLIPHAGNPPCRFDLETTCGAYSRCVCPPDVEGDPYIITPSKDDNPLNGVTTFDLVLISKHILSLDTLDSPYKIIAADANISNTITPIDIVELRKLILGIYSELPNNTSWRFITKSFSFSTSNPFEDIPFEEAISVELPILDADFVAIKVGDVNGSALVCSNCTAPRLTAPEPFGLTVPNVPVKAGDYVTIPVMANDQAALIAWQLGLRFDADRLELVGPALGDLNELYADNFGLTRADEGMLRVSWVARLQDEDGHLNIHDRLFYLTFRAKDNVTDISALLQLDNEVLANRGWLLDGTEYRLELQNSPVANRSMPSNNELSVSSRPNPAGKEAWLDVALPVTGRVRLSVYNSFGVRMLFREMELPAGAQTLALPEVANWSPGIYRYDLQAGKARGRGHLVKQ